MVRRIWQNRLALGIVRILRLFLRWLLIWASYLIRRALLNLRVFGHVLTLLIRPRNPNNLFLRKTEAAHEIREMTAATVTDEPGVDRQRTQSTLLWAAPNGTSDAVGPELDTTALSLWRGQQTVAIADALPAAQAANHRFAYLEVLAAQLKHLTSAEIEQMDELIARLARKWLDVDERFEQVPRRNKLDIGRTMRFNIPRYAGRVLTFKWAVKERPVPELAKPARILVIGDVSHSMVHYMTVVLYFMHKLNFRFQVDSYVFSQKPTHSAPYMNGLGTYEEKVKRLITAASSWNAGTRFGSALEEVAAQAYVDEYTYVIVGTDGKVSLQGDEADKIERNLSALKRRAKQVIFLTPSADFSDGASGHSSAPRVGSFKYGFFDIPIFEAGPPLWYGILGKYADRLYLVQTVEDLIDMTEDLIMASRD